MNLLRKALLAPLSTPISRKCIVLSSTQIKKIEDVFFFQIYNQGHVLSNVRENNSCRRETSSHRSIVTPPINAKQLFQLTTKRTTLSAHKMVCFSAKTFNRNNGK